MSAVLPDRLPSPSSLCLFIEGSKPQSGVQRGQPPSRRRPPGAVAAPGARPFPAVCCHLPSAAAGGGSRGAPRKPVTPEGARRGCVCPCLGCPSFTPSLDGGPKNPPAMLLDALQAWCPAGNCVCSYMSNLKVSGYTYVGCKCTYMCAHM